MRLGIATRRSSERRRRRLAVAAVAALAACQPPPPGQPTRVLGDLVAVPSLASVAEIRAAVPWLRCDGRATPTAGIVCLTEAGPVIVTVDQLPGPNLPSVSVMQRERGAFDPDGWARATLGPAADRCAEPVAGSADTVHRAEWPVRAGVLRTLRSAGRPPLVVATLLAAGVPRTGCLARAAPRSAPTEAAARRRR